MDDCLLASLVGNGMEYPSVCEVNGFVLAIAAFPCVVVDMPKLRKIRVPLQLNQDDMHLLHCC